MSKHSQIFLSKLISISSQQKNMCVVLIATVQREPSDSSSFQTFHRQHQEAPALGPLMTAFNLCRGPVSGSHRASLCVCLRETRCLRSQKDSASFHCGGLCVTSTVDPVGQSCSTDALCTPHFPTQHAAKPPHFSTMCTRSLKDKRTTLSCAQEPRADIYHKPKPTESTRIDAGSVGSVGDKGCRITGGPWGAAQAICLKHEQTECTAT